MTHPTFRRVALAILAALALVASSVLIAGAATRSSDTEATAAGKTAKKKPKPKRIRLACARTNGTLRYISRERECPPRVGKVLKIDPGPADLCVKKHGTRRGTRAAGRDGRRLPAGSTRITDQLTLCGQQNQPNEKPLRLPNTRKEWFCVERSSKFMRWVHRKPRCRTKGRYPEFVAYVAKGGPFPEPAAPQAPGPQNRAPKSTDDSASTDEDSPAIIPVLGNDTDDDGDALSVESVGTNGTRGAVTVNANGTVTYDPTDQFDDLKPGQTATDRFDYKAKDPSGAHSGTAHVDVTVEGDNDAPEVATSSGSPSFTENQASEVAVDPGVGITDVDDSSLDGASVAITAGRVNGDELHFTDQLGITGTYNTGTGVLTLTGTASVADYRTALRSVEFSTASNAPGPSRTIDFTADDGDDESDAASRGLNVVEINDGPSLTAPAATQTTAEDVAKVFSAGNGNAISGTDVDAGGDPVQLSLSVADGKLTFGALPSGVSVVSGANGSDTVAIAGPLSGVNSAADGLSYTGDLNFNGTDTLNITLSDLGNNGLGGALSSSDSVMLDVTAVDDAPVNTVPVAQSVDEDSDITLATSFSLVDVDAGIDDVKTTLSVNDGVLDVADGPAVTNDGTATVSIEGTLVEVNAALASVKYDPDGNFNGSDTLTMVTNDLNHNGAGGPLSDTDTVGFTVNAVNDAPVNSVPGPVTTDEDTPFAFTGAGAPSVSDADTPPLQVTFASTNGTLTLDGTSGLTFTAGDGTDDATMTFTGPISDINNALDGSHFDPTPNSSGSAQITLTSNDQGGTGTPGPLSDTDTIDVTVTAVNDAPTVDTSSGSAAFTELGAAVAIDPGVAVDDVDDTNLESATVKITSGHQATDVLDIPTPPVGFTVSHVPGSDTLTVTGTKTVAEYAALLKTVTFDSTSTSPGSSRTVTFTVNDGTDDSPATNDTRQIDITNINDAPVIADLGGTASYTENNPGETLDNDATVSDNDSPNLTGGTVTITNVKAGDELLSTPQGVVSGTYNSGTGVLTITGTGTVAQYQAFLRSVQYRNTSDTPDTTDRTIEFQVDDGQGASNLSNVATKTVNVTAVNDSPVVTTTLGNASYTEGGLSTVVDSGVTVTDADSLTVASGLVKIAGGHQTTDSLTWTGQPGITAIFDGNTGELTLTGPASPSAYQAVFQSVAFSSSSDNPGPSRSIQFSVDDGAALNHASNTAIKGISITQVNDSPVLTQPDGALTYTEDSPAENHEAAVAPNLTLTDADDANIASGTVQITAGGQNPEDDLLFADQSGITGSGSGTGSLTLTGSTTVANWQTALRSVRYRNVSDAPDGGVRTVSFQVSDGHTGDNPDSNIVSRGIDVEPTNDAPTADNETFNNGSRAIGNTSLVIHNGSGVPNPSGPEKSVDVADSEHPLHGDTDPDGPNALTVTSAGTAATNGTNGQTTNGGQVSVQSDGDFTYHPPAGCNHATDTFDYVVSDGHTPTAGTDQGTITVHLANCAWYVDDGAPGGGDGRSHSQFNSFASINSGTGAGDSDDPNDDIFVYPGSYSGGLTLENGQNLQSKRHGLEYPDGGAGTTTLETADLAGSHSTVSGGVVLGQDNYVQGIDFGSHSGFALSNTIATSVTTIGGTAQVNNVTPGAINNPSGGGVSVANGGNINFRFQDGFTTGGGTHGINLTGSPTGTFNADGPGTISGASATDVALNGGSVDLTLNPTISDDSGQLVSIVNKTSGTHDFNGPVNDNPADGDGGGISLQSNGTALTRFDGGVNLSTGSSNGIVASSGGTLAVPDPAGSNNTIDTGTASALNLAFTTIHDDDLVFERLSSSDPTGSGISLNTTSNANGRLFVTGNGSITGPCTGSASSCNGGVINSAGAAGISLISAPGGATLTRMAVTNSANDGIGAGDVAGGIALTNSLVSGNGNAVGHRGLDFDNVKGTNSITQSKITTSAEDNARWENDNGTLGLTVTNSEFSSNSAVSGADGLLLLGDGNAAMTAHVTGSLFQHNRDDGFQLGTKTPNTAQMNVTLTNNDIFQGVNNAPNNAAVHTGPGSNSDTKFKMVGNELRGSLGSALILNPGPDSTSSASYDAIIDGNTIGTAAVDSGSVSGIGLWGRAAGNGDNRFLIKNNIVQHYQQQGMYLRGNEGVGQDTDYTVTGNQVINPDGTSFTLLLEAGSTAGDATNVCFDVGGTGALSNTLAPGGTATVGVARDFAANTLTLRGYTPGGGTAGLSSYFQTRNTVTSGTLSAIFSGLDVAGQAGACEQPVDPATP